MNYYIAFDYVDVLYCYDVFYDVISYMVYLLHCILLTLYGNMVSHCIKIFRLELE